MVKVRATSLQDPTKFAEAEYTIDISIYPSDGNVIKVLMNEDDMITTKGSKVLISAKVVGVNITNPYVLWSLDGFDSIYTTIDTNGLVTISDEESTPALIAVASSAQDPTVKGYTVINLTSEEEKEEKGDGIEDIPETPVDKNYTRYRNADGTAEWRELLDAAEDAPSDVVGNKYVRETIAPGENAWRELEIPDASIPSMTAAEWNALAEEERPEYAYITDSWYKPNPEPIILDGDGKLFV